jgi:NAD(P)-dependent dehydrogenase (short-subunit alcohol dehydrogenase family)
VSGSMPPVVLVTGAGSGMGYATALHLAGSGFQVYGTTLTAEEEAALARGAEARGVHLRQLRMDISDPPDVHRAVATIVAESGGVDAVVNFAGMGLRGFLEDLELEEIRRVFDVNVFGAVALLQAILPHMRRAGRGRIVLTTSIAGRIGSLGIGGYASSKFAVEGMAECLAQEVAPFGISVSVLEPGLVLTEHFTRHRNRARRSLDATGPYYRWFCQHEALVDDLLARATFTTADVARLVERILRSRRPLLRYVIGRKARVVLTLRRYVPGELFQRLYWRMVRRLVTDPGRPVRPLS